MKLISKHSIPAPGCSSSLMLSAGAVVIGSGVEHQTPFVYVEAQEWGASPVYWDVRTVREGESYPDGMVFMAMLDDPHAMHGGKLFLVGRISG